MHKAGHCIVVTDEVWLELIRLKYNERCRNLDDVIRIRIGMKPYYPPVKMYADEGNDRVAQREPVRAD